MIDYLIVGCGLAGISFAETAIQNKKSVLVYNSEVPSASSVAAGIYNPVILKRFTATSDAEYQLQLTDSFYSAIEDKLNISFFNRIPVFRKLYSIQEQNDWFVAADKLLLKPFINPKIETKLTDSIKADFGYGKVNYTGYLDTNTLISNYINYLKSLNSYINESFEYDKIIFHTNYVEYKGQIFKSIVFAEGFYLHSNPFFNYLPLDGTKGEIIQIKAPKLDLSVIVNASLYIVPLGDDFYNVGATYNWDDKTNTSTEEGKKELVEKLKEIISCDFEIISHKAGVRPTVKDRRTLIGKHPEQNIFILNGLGTRGVLLAPFLSKLLFDLIENNVAIDSHYSISRYDKLFFNR